MTTEPDTVPRVNRPRGILSTAQQRRLVSKGNARGKAEIEYRAEVLAVLGEGASFSEVSRFTGLSTRTLQNWKREVGK